MSQYWNLYCITCDTNSFANWNYGETYLARLLKDEPAKRALVAVAEWRRSNSPTRDVLCVEYAACGLESPYDIGNFLIDHYGHDVTIRNEYGAFSGRCSQYYKCICGSIKPCNLIPGHDGDHDTRVNMGK
jgi:hypothetical protein